MPSAQEIGCSVQPYRLLHSMLRVSDLDRSLAFYSGALGMRLLRREEYPGGRFTLAFVGYGTEQAGALLELTHNWDQAADQNGSAFGHLALAVSDVLASCAALAVAGVEVVREPGPMRFGTVNRNAPEVIAFIEDPDGYQIELVEIRPV